MRRVFGVVIGLALAACGARQVNVAPADPPPVVPDAAPTTSAMEDSGTPPPVDEAAEYQAVLAHGKEGNAALSAALSSFLGAHPGSRFVPDALIALGDLEVGKPPYDPAKLALAKAHYKAAIFREAAAFKLARVHWLLGELEDGLDAFNRVTWISQDAKTFRNLALAELPASFASDRTPAEALAFIRRLHGDPPMVTKLLELLAQAYDERAKYPETRAIYDELRRQDPVRICHWNVLYRHASPAANPATLDSDLAKCP